MAGRATRLAAAVLTVAVGNTAAASGDEISITGLNWDAAQVIAAILETTIEDRFDVDVVIREGVTDEALASMDAGDGRYDIFPDIWMPNQKAAWQKYVEERRTIRHNGGYAAIQGFFLPADTASDLDLQYIEDLRSPEVAARFDTDGDGLGEYWAGEESWGATILNQIKMKSYGLDDLWEPWIASNADFKAAFISAAESDTPVLFYHWTPEWIFGAYELIKLAEPAYFDGCDKVFQPGDRDDWLEASEFPCAFEASEVFVFYSSRLERDHADVAKFLANVSFDPLEISEWVRSTGLDDLSPELTAQEWLERHPEIVAAWTR